MGYIASHNGILFYMLKNDCQKCHNLNISNIYLNQNKIRGRLNRKHFEFDKG